MIPLTVYEVSYGLNGKITEEEYKKLYMKHLHKKVQTADNPDKLITGMVMIDQDMVQNINYLFYFS